MCNSGYIEHTHMLLSLLNVDTALHEKKQCFGTMCVITLSFLDTFMSKYPLFIIAPFFTTRLHRMRLERVFAILRYELLGRVDTLYGDIVLNVPHTSLTRLFRVPYTPSRENDRC